MARPGGARMGLRRSAVCLAAAAAVGLAASLSMPSKGLAAAAAGAAASGKLAVPAQFATAMAEAWTNVDLLEGQVDRLGVVVHYGRLADTVVKRAIKVAAATGDDAEGLEMVLDAPLRALFQQQLQTLMARAADKYDSEMAKRPNPLEATWAAEKFFTKAAADLVRPGSGWSFETEHKDLLESLKGSYSRDVRVVEEQSKAGQGKQVTIEVIRKLQQQAAVVQREADTRGAFPWNVKWQYFVENSPLGFRGQYNQGRSVVELLLMPSPDPRQKKNLLNRIGPLNLAVAFDMLL